MNAPVLLLAAAGAVIAASLAYMRLLRPWQLRWGAAPDEIRRALPGDELVAEPSFNATRAITIAARPDHIWPWLLQVGVTRAGWYSYDLLDNLARPSAREIIPELQQVAVGDVVPLSPDGMQGVQILALDLPRSMLWGTQPNTTWLWVCEPRTDGTTRLITRIRSHYRWLSPSIAFSLLVEFADIWMIRKMLLNLRERAEGLARAEGSGGTPLQRETVA